jgi:broad specificity phosphatase PhoE
VAELILVRHGQAQSHATDSDSYDQLSNLGYTQARGLGEHMAETNGHFDHVYTGTSKRQIQTAESMGYGGGTQDERLNELDYFAMADALEQQRGVPAPTDPTEFAAHLPEVMQAWHDDAIEGVPEKFAEFEARIVDIIEEAAQGHGRILMVTSGGVIGMVVRHVLGLNNGGLSKVMLQVMNSSFHEVPFIHNQLMLAGFNATPHLDLPGREHARTFV